MKRRGCIWWQAESEVMSSSDVTAPAGDATDLDHPSLLITHQTILMFKEYFILTSVRATRSLRRGRTQVHCDSSLTDSRTTA